MGIFSRLASAFRLGPKPMVTTGGGFVPTLPLWGQFSRTAGSPTPAEVSSYLRSADGGDPEYLINFANDLRQKDGHLQSILGTRENALANVPLTVTPFKDRGDREPTDRDAEVAAFVEEAIFGAVGDGQDLRSLDDLIPHLQGGVYHGFSNAETVWQRDGRYLIPEGFSLLNQRRFKFRSSDGRLVFSDTACGYGYDDGVDLMATYPGQYLQHMPRVNGDVPCREGLSHLLIWPASFRNYGTGDWLKLAELAWKPWRIAELTKDASDKDKTDAPTFLQQLTTNGVGIHGPNLKPNFIWPGQEGKGSSGSTHKEMCEYFGAEMSKATLGQTLTTEQGSSGAYSLGKVHDEVRKDIRDQDAKAIAATLRRDLVQPLVWLNFGAVPIPRLAFETEDAPDRVEFAKAITQLKTAGLRIPEAWVYDVAGVPPPQEDEAVLGESEDDPDAVDVDVSDLDDGNEPEPDDDNDSDE